MFLAEALKIGTCGSKIMIPEIERLWLCRTASECVIVRNKKRGQVLVLCHAILGVHLIGLHCCEAADMKSTSPTMMRHESVTEARLSGMMTSLQLSDPPTGSHHVTSPVTTRHWRQQSSDAVGDFVGKLLTKLLNKMINYNFSVAC